MAKNVSAATGVELVGSHGMSKHNNVNPGQYKVGGRLHPGDDKTEQERAKAQASINAHESSEESRRSQKKKQKK